MTYEYQREGGERLLVQNQGGQTTIHLHSRGFGQEQSQASGFTTGEWTEKPELYRQGEDWMLVLPTPDGRRTVSISRGGVQQQSGAEVPEGAESLPLREVDDSSLPKIKPMEWMKPMEPMRPMKPFKPLF